MAGRYRHGATAGGFTPTQGFVLTVSATPTPPQYVGSISGMDYGYVPLDHVAIDAAGQFHDPQGQALTYTATQSNGNPLPVWLHFDFSHELDPFHGSDLGGTVVEPMTAPALSGTQFWSGKPGSGNDLDRALWDPIENGMPDSFNRTGVVAAAAGYAGSVAGEYVGGMADGWATQAAAGATSYATGYALNNALGDGQAFRWRDLLTSTARFVLSQGISRGLGVSYRGVPGTNCHDKVKCNCDKVKHHRQARNPGATSRSLHLGIYLFIAMNV